MFFCENNIDIKDMKHYTFYVDNLQILLSALFFSMILKN